MTIEERHWVNDLLRLARANIADERIQLSADELRRLFDLSVIMITAPYGETITPDEYLGLGSLNSAGFIVSPSEIGLRILREIETIEAEALVQAKDHVPAPAPFLRLVHSREMEGNPF